MLHKRTAYTNGKTGVKTSVYFSFVLLMLPSVAFAHGNALAFFLNLFLQYISLLLLSLIVGKKGDRLFSFLLIFVCYPGIAMFAVPKVTHAIYSNIHHAEKAWGKVMLFVWFLVLVSIVVRRIYREKNNKTPS